MTLAVVPRRRRSCSSAFWPRSSGSGSAIDVGSSKETADGSGACAQIDGVPEKAETIKTISTEQNAEVVAQFARLRVAIFPVSVQSARVSKETQPEFIGANSSNGGAPLERRIGLRSAVLFNMLEMIGVGPFIT